MRLISRRRAGAVTMDDCVLVGLQPPTAWPSSATARAAHARTARSRGAARNTARRRAAAARWSFGTLACAGPSPQRSATCDARRGSADCASAPAACRSRPPAPSNVVFLQQRRLQPCAGRRHAGERREPPIARDAVSTPSISPQRGMVYLYIYIYLYLSIYLYIYIYLSIYMYIYIYISIDIYIYIYIYIYR